MNQPFLSIRGITKSFGAVCAVDDVSLDIEKGEFVTFLGPSGSGKSTTLYAIAGFLAPTRGDVLLEGESLLKRSPNKRNIGMVFQRYTLFPHLSVADNIAFPLKIRRRRKEQIDDKVSEMLRLVRLEGMGSRMPGNMSGGQQQRVALARALAYDPPILLMDEPLSALDKRLREEIQEEIRRIHRETGVTILYVTHDQEEALYLSDRVAVFNEGRIEQLGSGRDLYERPSSRFVAGFVGDSNMLEGEVLAGSDLSSRIQFPDGSWLQCTSALDGGPAVAMVRPDRLGLQSETSDDSSGIAGTIIDQVFLGDHTRLTVGTRWDARIAVHIQHYKEQHTFDRGAPVRLTCSPEALHIYR